MKQFWSWDKRPPIPFLHSIISSENCANGSDDCFTRSESSQYKLVFFYTQGFTALCQQEKSKQTSCVFILTLCLFVCLFVCLFLFSSALLSHPDELKHPRSSVLFCCCCFFVKCHSRRLGCSAFGQLSKHFYLMFLIVIGLSVTATCSSGCFNEIPNIFEENASFLENPTRLYFKMAAVN